MFDDTHRAEFLPENTVSAQKTDLTGRGRRCAKCETFICDMTGLRLPTLDVVGTHRTYRSRPYSMLPAGL